MALKLTQEEQWFLRHVDGDTLRLFVDINDHKHFLKLKKFYVMFVDIEKNAFFNVNEQSVPDEKLEKRLAYAKGGIAAIGMFIRMFAGAREELERREAISEDRKQKKV